MSIDILAFGDPHIKPANPAIDFDRLTVPTDVDVVVTIGDVVQRTDDLETGRKFFARLNEAETPVICVPGNHDPAEYYPKMIDDFENVTLAHDRVVTAADLGVSPDGECTESTFIGFGCEETDPEPEFGTWLVEALDPREESNRRRSADIAAGTLENAVYDYLVGDLNGETLLSTLDVRREERLMFLDGLSEIERRFDRVDALLGRVDTPDIFLSHVPPYNTGLDRHQSVGERERDMEGLHVGSLAVKAAVRKHNPFVALSGHSHNREYTVGTADAPDRPHFLSLDFRGVVRISADPTTETYAYEFL